MANRFAAFFAELRRRNVFKVAVAYLVVAWLLIEVAASVFPSLGLQAWTVTLVIVLVAIGFPVALVLAWAYELQPAGEKAASAEALDAAAAGPQPASSAAGPTARTAAAPPAAEPQRTVGDDGRPSIAVLPFLNMMGDSAQEYFADGMTEDLITDLSKISGLCVIARNSTFTFKGQAIDVREAARTLGARYVVEGSVRKGGERVRINAQLIDAQSGTHLWAERYDGELAGVFELQDEIVAKIVSALQVNLNIGEKLRLESRLTSNLEAYDLFLKGRNDFYRLTPESLTAATELLEQAVALDPGFAAAYAYLSHARMGRALLSSSPEEREAALRAGLEPAEAAVAADDSLGSAHAALGWCQIWLRRYDEAMASFERALALAPNDAEVLGHYATALVYVGELERAMTMFDLAMKLDPLLPPSLRFQRGVCLFLLERYEEALDALRGALHLAPTMPGAHWFCIAALAELGRVEEAKAAASEAKRIRTPLEVAEMLRRVPIRDERVRERVHAAFRAAGVLD